MQLEKTRRGSQEMRCTQAVVLNGGWYFIAFQRENQRSQLYGTNALFLDITATAISHKTDKIPLPANFEKVCIYLLFKIEEHVCHSI